MAYICFLFSLVKQHRHVAQCKTECCCVDSESKWTALCDRVSVVCCGICVCFVYTCNFICESVGLFGHKTFYFSFCPYLFASIAVVAVAPIVAAGIVIYCVKSAPIPKAKPRVLYRGIFLVFFFCCFFGARK